MTFVLSDESVNSHGTWVKTEGIDLRRFEANPVMLWSHDSAFPPIGRWVNIRKEDGRLLAEAEFDEKDALAQALKGKVEQGILRACSIGFYAKKFSNRSEDLKPGQRYETIVESEIIEASLCAVGSNANAMRLYTDKGEAIELSNESGIRLSGMRRLETNNTDKTMTEEEVKALKTEVEELKAYKAQKEKEDEERAEVQRKELVENAIKAGKITKKEEAVWLQLAKDNYESAKLALDAMVVSVKLSELLRQPSAEKSKYAGKSWKELDREGKLAQLKAEDRELFDKLYREEFGKDYIG